MGCCQSNYSKVVFLEDYGKWKLRFEALGLTQQQIDLFYKCFSKVDAKSTGVISILDFLMALDIERTPLIVKIFSIFDEDKSGLLNFGEFVLAIWNFCSLTTDSLAVFVFELYTRGSQSGYLETDHIDELLNDIYGSSYKKNNSIQGMLGEIHHYMMNGMMSLNKFVTFSSSHQSLLFPIFNLQQKLRHEFLGLKFWAKEEDRRYKISKDKYMKISDFLDISVSNNQNLIQKSIRFIVGSKNQQLYPEQPKIHRRFKSNQHPDNGSAKGIINNIPLSARDKVANPHPLSARDRLSAPVSPRDNPRISRRNSLNGSNLLISTDMNSPPLSARGGKHSSQKHDSLKHDSIKQEHQKNENRLSRPGSFKNINYYLNLGEEYSDDNLVKPPKSPTKNAPKLVKAF